MMVVLGSCSNEPTERPRPRAYHKITYPERKVVSFSSEDCPFAFEHMSYAQPQKDEAFFDEPPEHPCWFDLNMPIFNGKWHFSYHPIQDRAHFDKLVADAFKLSQKHNVKANYIDEIVFKKGKDVSGIIFDMEGPVASPYQLFITDSTKHFLRGSLYLQAQTNPDSLRPIIDYIKKDLDVILNKFSWQ
jgi:gliding motility-associated lipoprotein GldD